MAPVTAARPAPGLVDSLSLHLSPVLLGGGTPCFRENAGSALVQRSMEATSTATHLTYDVAWIIMPPAALPPRTSRGAGP